jgi:hypothetical protein
VRPFARWHDRIVASGRAWIHNQLSLLQLTPCRYVLSGHNFGSQETLKMKSLKDPPCSQPALFTSTTLWVFFKWIKGLASTGLRQITTTVPCNSKTYLNRIRIGLNTGLPNEIRNNAQFPCYFWDYAIPYSELKKTFLRLFIVSATPPNPKTALKYLSFSNTHDLFAARPDWHTSCNYCCSYPHKLLRHHLTVT